MGSACLPPSAFAQRRPYLERCLTSRKCLVKRTSTESDSQYPKVQLLTIWFGANDACIPPSPQHVPLPRFTELVTEIVRTIKSPTSPYYAPWTRIIILTAPPVNTYQRGADLAARDPPRALDRLFDVTKQYATAAREVGETEGVPVVDVWTMLWEACGERGTKAGEISIRRFARQ